MRLQFGEENGLSDRRNRLDFISSLQTLLLCVSLSYIPPIFALANFNSTQDTDLQFGEQYNLPFLIMDKITPAVPNLTIFSCNQTDANFDFDPHEIASLLGNYYHLLARMRYFPHSVIKHPPHNPPIDLPFAQSLGLEPQVIELLQLLPYVEGLGNEEEFILWGSFADLRDNEVLMQSRDPDYVSPEGGYEEERGEYVLPWVLTLNSCGNHGSIMYLDTRNGIPPFLIKIIWCSKTLMENRSYHNAMARRGRRWTGRSVL
jgi:hypothetical protein